MAIKQKRLVLRLPIRVTVFDAKTDETIVSGTYSKQSELAKFVQLQVKEYRGKNVAFVARVMYDRKQDSFNEFIFTSLADFKEKLEPCLERPLLKELLKDGMLVKDYVQGL